MALEMEHLPPEGTHWESMEGCSQTGDFEGKVRFCLYQGMCRRRPWKWVFLSVGTLLGNLGGGWGGPFTGNFERQLKEGSRNVASFSM